MQLWRAHGLGNDYLVWEGPPLKPALVVALCDRHRGVGGDGVLEPTRSARADFGVRIWNPDGSVAEKSGNGLRIFSRYLVGERGAPVRHSIDTGTDVVHSVVGDALVTVEMGTAVFDVVEERWEVTGDALVVTTLSVGNPHCVTFTDAPLDTLPWRRWGEALEVHPHFPQRTNVQVARVVEPGVVEIRIWERGAGPTLASGSSSCAVAAAAVHTGRLAPGAVEVRMPGGVLQVEVRSDLALRLTGPVEPVGRIHLDPGWWRARTA